MRRHPMLPSTRQADIPIKLDDLAAPDDNTDLDASSTKHGLLPRSSRTRSRFSSGTGAWLTRVFGADFKFGDGSAVVVAQACGARIPGASKITKAYIRSISTSGALLSGSITITIYVHDYNAAPGSAVDSFALSAASSFAETGLNIAVDAGKWATIIISGYQRWSKIVLQPEIGRPDELQ